MLFYISRVSLFDGYIKNTLCLVILHRHVVIAIYDYLF